MDTNFNLKEVNLLSENSDKNVYTLKFANEETDKTINLSGRGKVKVPVKI